jgi:hypothetical protein
MTSSLHPVDVILLQSQAVTHHTVAVAVAVSVGIAFDVWLAGWLVKDWTWLG